MDVLKTIHIKERERERQRERERKKETEREIVTGVLGICRPLRWLMGTYQVQISDIHLILYSTLVMTRTSIFPELPYFHKILSHKLTDGINFTFIPNLQFDLITVSVSRQYGDLLSSTCFHFHQ